MKEENEKIKIINNYINYNRLGSLIPEEPSSIEGISSLLDLILKLFEKKEIDDKKRSETEERIHRLYDDEREKQKTMDRLNKKRQAESIELAKQQRKNLNLEDMIGRQEKALKDAKEAKERLLLAKFQTEKTFNHELKRKNLEIDKLKERISSLMKKDSIEGRVCVTYLNDFKEENDLVEEKERFSDLLEEINKKENIFVEESRELRKLLYEQIQWYCRVYSQLKVDEEGFLKEIEAIEFNIPITLTIERIKKLSFEISKNIEESIFDIQNQHFLLEKEFKEFQQKKEEELKQAEYSVAYEKKIKENNEIIISVLREEIDSIKRVFSRKNEEGNKTKTIQPIKEDSLQENKLAGNIKEKNLTRTVLKVKKTKEESSENILKNVSEK